MKDILLYLRVILSTHKYLWISVPVVALLVWFLGLIVLENMVVIKLSKLNDITLQTERNQLLYSIASRRTYRISIMFTTFLPLIHLYFIKNLLQKDYHFSLPIRIVNKYITFISFGIFIYILNFIVISLLNYGLEIYLQHNYYDELMRGYEQAGHLYNKISDNSIFYNGQVNLDNLKYSYLFIILLPAFYLMILYFKNYSLLIFIVSLSIMFPSFIISVQKIENLLGLNFHFGYSISNEHLTYYYNFFLYLITACLFNYSFYMLLKEKEI